MPALVPYFLYKARLEGKPHRSEYPKTGEVIDGVEYDGLTPKPTENGRYCYATVTHKATLGEIVEILNRFHDQPENLMIRTWFRAPLRRSCTLCTSPTFPKRKRPIPSR